MSNGAAIRSAAKAAAYRSPSIFTTTSTLRRTSFPSSSVPPPEPALSAVTSEKPLSEAAPQRPLLNLDDWDFNGWPTEEFNQLAPPTRVVFGPVPTFEEAKAATADLKDAVQRSNISQVATADSAIMPKMPKHVAQAFSFLQESPEAQDVVASLACDKSVWNAVMSNEKVMEFYNSHQAVITQADSENSSENANSNASEGSIGSSVSSGFMGFIKNIKTKTEVVVKNISSSVEDILGKLGLPGNKCAQSNAGSDDEACAGMGDKEAGAEMGTIFFRLAIVAILVILFKRI